MSQRFSNFKMVFTLWAKVIAFYMQTAIMEIALLRLERLIGIIPVYCIILSLLNADFYELSEQIVGRN